MTSKTGPMFEARRNDPGGCALLDVGAMIAVIVLKEQLRAARAAAAILIVTGLVLIRLQ